MSLIHIQMSNELSTSNGFFNFERYLDPSNFGKDTGEPSVSGGKPRNRTESMEKHVDACCPKKRKAACTDTRTPACRPMPQCPRPKPRCSKPKAKCVKPKQACTKPKTKSKCKKYKCSKPGPVTANAYLSYLRTFRRKVCGLSPQETVKAGACAWGLLTKKQKERYKRQACKVTQSCRHKRRKVCTSK